MSHLQTHHIIDVYCLVDDYLPTLEPKTGRPATLSHSEVITILVWNSLTIQSKTLKGIYNHVVLYHQHDFRLPAYSKFVEAAHRAIPLLHYLLTVSQNHTASVRIMDSTMLPVCKNHRIDSHKVAKDIADFGRNWQGWHYGFKLHASVDQAGQLCGFLFTPANTHDIYGMPRILNEHCAVAVGDTSYGAKVMGRIIHEHYGTVIIAPPHPKQKKKLVPPEHLELLNQRSKIESVFNYLKEHLHLISSFPRSVAGYFLHYLRVLVGYQFRF